MIGEIGGGDEEHGAVGEGHEEADRRLHCGRNGATRQADGSCGAIISGGKGTAQEKLAVMEARDQGDAQSSGNGQAVAIGLVAAVSSPRRRGPSDF